MNTSSNASVKGSPGPIAPARRPMEDTKILADEYRQALAASQEAGKRYERAQKTVDTAKCLLAHHLVVLVETQYEWAQDERYGTTRQAAAHAVEQLKAAHQNAHQAWDAWDESARVLGKRVFHLSQAVVESTRFK